MMLVHFLSGMRRGVLHCKVIFLNMMLVSQAHSVMMVMRGQLGATPNLLFGHKCDVMSQSWKGQTAAQLPLA